MTENPGRPNTQIVLQETIRRLPVVATASASTASDPLLRSFDDATPIISDGGVRVALIQCILCDGKGSIMPNAVLRVRVGNKVATGVFGGDVTITTGTFLSRTDYCNTDASDNLGGIIDVQSSDAGVVSISITAATTPIGITLEHLFVIVGGSFAF